MYAPDIARWNGLDISSENYYESSPYHYAGNNPVKFVDFDGNDYGVIVKRGSNGGMGTITIKARFLVSRDSEANLNRNGRDQWNAQSGKNVFVAGGLKALRQGKASVYNVEVDVSTQVSGGADGQGRQESDRDALVKADQTGTLNSFDVESTGYRKANQRGGTFSDQVDVKPGEGGGTTEHEVSHAMGVGHTDEGGNLSPTGDGNVNSSYVAESLKGVGIGGDTSARNSKTGTGDGTLLNGSSNQGLQTGKLISVKRYNRIMERIERREQRRLDRQ